MNLVASAKKLSPSLYPCRSGIVAGATNNYEFGPKFVRVCSQHLKRERTTEEKSIGLLACFSRFRSADSTMECAKKMALVDPLRLECVPSEPLSANPIGSITRRLDDEMRFILDRGDLNDREKVVLYNQVLMR